MKANRKKNRLSTDSHGKSNQKNKRVPYIMRNSTYFNGKIYQSYHFCLCLFNQLSACTCTLIKHQYQQGESSGWELWETVRQQWLWVWLIRGWRLGLITCVYVFMLYMCITCCIYIISDIKVGLVSRITSQICTILTLLYKGFHNEQDYQVTAQNLKITEIKELENYTITNLLFVISLQNKA